VAAVNGEGRTYRRRNGQLDVAPTMRRAETASVKRNQIDRQLYARERLSVKDAALAWAKVVDTNAHMTENRRPAGDRKVRDAQMGRQSRSDRLT